MEIKFDISEEERPIFLAEVDEHLQVLDEVLIRLEREDADPELVQSLFRSAHTIKGMSGMIGHQRMTDLTHALETVLDKVRRNDIQITPELINVCLTAVDHLRSLREEVSTSQMRDVNVEEVILPLKQFIDGGKQEAVRPEPKIEPVEKAPSTIVEGRQLQVKAKIDTHSMASAARAFQLMMALQDLGDIQSMTPTQAQIEAAKVVADFSAVVVTSQSEDQVRAALNNISGVNEIQVQAVQVESAPAPRPAPESTIDATERRSSNPFGRRTTDMTIRMNVERLDTLMNLVGELIMDRNHLKQIHGRLTRLNSNYDKITETIAHLGRITDQIQEEVMHIRMLPIASVFGKFPRMVHDLSQKINKQIDVVIEGEKTEMDRSMLEEINDPLIHLVRNSVDHGIESPEKRRAAGKSERGRITLTARHEQGRIILTVEDDGRGIDTQKLRQSAVQKGLISAEDAAALTEEQAIDLMFLAGLSTAEKVTDISGRGVGLDIVNNNIQRINGTILVESELGIGTCFQIILPLTLAIMPSLLVKVQQNTLAIPLVMITETFRLERTDIKYVYHKPVTMLRESVLSLMELSSIFNLPQEDASQESLYVVVVQSGKQKVGLIVDWLLGEEDVVVKPLGSFIGDIAGISSAAILGEGQVALIVDVFGLFRLAGI